MDKKVQAALLFIIAVFIFMLGTKYGDVIMHQQKPEEELVIAQNQQDIAKSKSEQKNVDAKSKPDTKIYIHVAGAVKRPGLYSLQSGARVDDAVRMAEVLPTADLDLVNLAEKLSDGEKIVVPTKGAQSDANLIPKAGTESENNSKSQGGEKLININTATVEELDTLPGIGPAYAERIVQYRTENGAFEKIEDLQQVQGIGPKKYENIKERITVN